MQMIDQIQIHRYHKHRREQYGEDTARALGWKTREGQMARFEALSQIGDLHNKSVLDAGCGHGDLFGYLNERFKGIRYLGVDLEESFLEVAIRKCGAIGETAFFLGDFANADLPFADYILASGALSYHNSEQDYVYKTITRLFNTCRFGLGFNMLSKSTDPRGLLVAHELGQILAHCGSLSSRVVFKEGYYENDFTVMIYH